MNSFLAPKTGQRHDAAMTEKIAIAADHAAYQLKEQLKADLVATGYDVVDYGTDSEARVDASDYAAKLVQGLKKGDAVRGILLCGTGIAMSMAANRYKGMRAALVHDVTTARLCREHNDANILCLGARVLGHAVAKDCMETFLKTESLGGRYQSRVAKLDELG